MALTAEWIAEEKKGKEVETVLNREYFEDIGENCKLSDMKAVKLSKTKLWTNLCYWTDGKFLNSSDL